MGFRLLLSNIIRNNILYLEWLRELAKSLASKLH